MRAKSCRTKYTKQWIAYAWSTWNNDLLWTYSSIRRSFWQWTPPHGRIFRLWLDQQVNFAVSAVCNAHFSDTIYLSVSVLKCHSVTPWRRLYVWRQTTEKALIINMHYNFHYPQLRVESCKLYLREYLAHSVHSRVSLLDLCVAKSGQR